jgi:hypothetical protein
VDFYYDSDGGGADGVAIPECQDKAEGTDATCTWDPSDDAGAGTWYVYGRYADETSPVFTEYSSGALTVSAAANDAPSLTVSQPDGVSDEIAEAGTFDITYDLSDTEDVATVDFYYDSNNSGADGTAITECQNQAEGTGATCTWTPSDDAGPGTWYVYGIADDGVNSPVTVYSSGALTVNGEPSVAISQPDGVGDSIVNGSTYDITYDLSDAEEVVTVDFYYDSNNSGADGAAISECQNQAEGTGATCTWDPSDDAKVGTWYVYGIADDGVNPTVTEYSTGPLTVTSGGGAPDPPTGVSLSGMNNLGPLVSWNTVSGATKYNIYNSPDGSSWTYLGTVDHPTSSYRVTTAEYPNTKYWWTVTAENGSGESTKPAGVAGRTALRKGWNIVSAPKATSGSATQVFGSWAHWSWYWNSTSNVDPDNSG